MLRINRLPLQLGLHVFFVSAHLRDIDGKLVQPLLVCSLNFTASWVSTFLLRNSSSFIAESSSHCFPVRQRQRPKQRLWSACEPYSGRRAIKYYQLANSVAMSQLATCCNPSKNINAFFANHFVCCSWIHRVCVHLWRSLHHSSSFIIVHHRSSSFYYVYLSLCHLCLSLSISICSCSN